ncbi:MAG: trypsin-like peptidase domain-containing protein [Planctomycetota bacterium]|nr:trypsin-like peptidase domain-containing protein [Planctomycetota bacterium]
MSLYVLLLGLLWTPGSQSDFPVVVHFTAPWCAACQKMKPAVKNLQNQGYDIRIVDVTKNETLAKRYRVQDLPHTFVVQNGKIQRQQIGYLTEQKLQSFIQKSKPVEKKPQVVHPVTTISRAAILEGGSFGAPPSRWISVNRAGLQPLIQRLPNAPGRQLLRATVRIELRDDLGISYGSGTIIHAQQGQALVATCGHLFRDSKSKTSMGVDVFYPDGMKRVNGRVLIYDAERFDIALVTIPFNGGITPIKLASQATLTKGQRVFSAGSNGGAKPTLERTVINSLNRYEGPDNIQIDGAPAGGRSGGGLIDQNGHLIGICNAADHKDDEGFYTHSRYIALFMQRLGIDDLLENQR